MELLGIVRCDCPKCMGKRARETNRVTILDYGTKKPAAFILRFKCLSCGYSWIKYETVKD